ncbi:uncharacterized protein LOC141718626 [Apium graveolens]|uniref:uncharacterized protein LOC141718626 n=1 Tax=Apium graveolens TaxID=4045 RepID=UPI003D7BBDFB
MDQVFPEGGKMQSNNSTGIQSIYRKLRPDNCTRDLDSPHKLEEIRVFSEKYNPDLKQYVEVCLLWWFSPLQLPEVFLCFANSVALTRFLLQDEFNIQTTKCDNCIIAFMVCLQQLACIFSLVAIIVGSDEISEASQILNYLSDIILLIYFPLTDNVHTCRH